MDDAAHADGLTAGPVGAPRWARRWLIAAGVYNLVWGALVVLFPLVWFDLAGMERPTYPQLWQCVGMIVGVYGIGYLAAARDPWRHWPIVLVGLLGKIFGPIGFAQAVIEGAFPPAFGLTILTNDLLWWVPFSMMLWGAAKHHGAPAGDAPSLEVALQSATDQRGRSLREISGERPTLTLLVRHSGCTFCKEALSDLAQQRERIEEAGLAIAVVSMSDADSLARVAGRYGLGDVHLVSDPQRSVYRALEVGRGSFMQLFGPVVWVRGLVATLRGHVVGGLEGDGFQMPGAFVLHEGKVIRAYRHKTAADRPDLAAFSCSMPS
ncbi:MAG: SelL-related redox protein [Phycisphaerales bacterium]